MIKLDFRASYRKLVEQLQAAHGQDRAMELAVGGEFEAVGLLEKQLLIQLGLRPEHHLIDVGCGSGRLSKHLRGYLTGPYLGTDVIPELVTHAARLADKPGWRFEVTEGLQIPEADGRANMVCFFSVFTHLLHEQSYVYLQEAKRVLKPGGRVVLSFLDFNVTGHWPIFEGNVADVEGDKPLNMFISPDALRCWARHLEMEVELLADGDKYQIMLPEPVRLENGQELSGQACLGQSICVLRLGD